VAINASLDDFPKHEANARLWLQTERIKGDALAAAITAKEKHWSIAAAGAGGANGLSGNARADLLRENTMSTGFCRGTGSG
jgi:hypothetical protein